MDVERCVGTLRDMERCVRTSRTWSSWASLTNVSCCFVSIALVEANRLVSDILKRSTSDRKFAGSSPINSKYGMTWN